MKLLFVSPGSRYTSEYPFEAHGSEFQILGLARELAKLGYQVSITGRFETLEDQQTGENRRVEFINVDIPRLRDETLQSIPSYLLYSAAVLGEMHSLEPDVVSLNERFSGYFPSKSSIPKTFTTHNPDAMIFYRGFAIANNRINNVFFGIKNCLEEGVMRRSSTVVALNRYLGDYLTARGIRNSRVIPNAVDPANYSSQGDENYVLYAGRLSAVKGVQDLITAFSMLSRSHDTRLMIVGSGPDETAMRRLARVKQLESKIEFHPRMRKEELRSVLSRCSLFVLPSLFEGMPVTLLEAMASQKPVIVSDWPGVGDLVRHEEDGMIFRRGETSQLADEMLTLLEDCSFRRRIGEEARRTIAKRFSFKTAAKQYDDLFQSITS